MIFPRTAFCVVVFLLARVGAELCEVQYASETTISPDIDDDAGTISSNNSSSSTEEELGTNSVHMSCPRPTDPQEYIFCCYESLSGKQLLLSEEGADGTNVSITRCCPDRPSSSLFPFVSDKIALIIACSVTGLLTFLTVGIVFCCFSPRCPLYMACRIRYRQEDVIAYASKEETETLNTMPSEEKKGLTTYSPNAVKITKKEEA